MSGGQIQSGGAGGVIRGEFIENSNIRFLAYLTKANGSVLTSANVQGFVRVRVFQHSGETPTDPLLDDSTTYSATTVVLAALSTDGWTRDSIGYNFDLTIPSTRFSQQGGMDYRIEFTIQLQPSGNMPVIFDLFCRGSVT